MEWLAVASDILASGGLGAIVGGIFSWVQKREEREALKLRLAHEQAMADIDLQREAADQAHSIALADKGMELAEVEGDIARDVQAGEIFRDTIHAQSAASGHPLIDGALRFVRPLLTVYLLGVLSYLGISLHLIVGGLETLPQNELISMYKHVIEQIVFMAVTATFWWFGVRGVSKK